MSESTLEDMEEVDGGGNHGDADIEDDADAEEAAPESDNVVDGLVVANAQDRSFSEMTYKHGPSGGFRLRKPDIILLSRNLRHFLKKHNLRPHWHHVEAILEVSASAPHADMIRQILEKTSLMFEASICRRSSSCHSG